MKVFLINCLQGTETATISGQQGLECVDCSVGFHNAEDGTAVCVECQSPNVALTTRQSSCVLCEPGTGWATSSTCNICPAGQRSKDGLCVDCTFNEITSQGDFDNNFLEFYNILCSIMPGFMAL